MKYDIAGNVTIDQKFRGLRYRYDANGRMWKSANVDNTAESTSVYDGLGQRVQTTDSNNTKTLVYDAFGRLVSEYDTQAQTGSGTKYLMSDLQGSARVLTNESGTVIARHDYQAFGGEIGATTGLRTTDQKYNVSDSTRQRYALTQRDATGLDHADWRKYDSSGGRWTTPDPYKGSIGDPQSFNRYSYVENDPVNFVDPSGLLPWSLWNSLFPDGYFIPASQQGWNQIYGLNPITITFETGHGRVGDWYWTEYTTYILQNSGFREWRLEAINGALNLARAMTNRKKGSDQKKCDEALKKLTNGKISSLNALVSQYIASGAGLNIFDGRNVSAGSYGTNSPTVPGFVLGVGTSNATTYLNSKFFNFTGFGAVQAQAIVLLHEAVHQFGGLRDVDFDPSSKKNQDVGSRNITNAVIDNCAPALREVFKGLHL